jgi:hypothetical protein
VSPPQFKTDTNCAHCATSLPKNREHGSIDNWRGRQIKLGALFRLGTVPSRCLGFQASLSVPVLAAASGAWDNNVFHLCPESSFFVSQTPTAAHCYRAAVLIQSLGRSCAHANALALSGCLVFGRSQPGMSAWLMPCPVVSLFRDLHAFP